MNPCACGPGYCAREEGLIPVKSRDTLCKGRPVVARHRPTIVAHLWPSAGFQYWESAFDPLGVPMRTWYEPVEDEE